MLISLLQLPFEQDGVLKVRVAVPCVEMVVWEDGDRYSVYLLYWYFTGTTVQKLTLRALSTARKAPARASLVA